MQLPANINIEFNNKTSTVHITWEEQIMDSQKQAKDNDQINIVAYNVKLNGLYHLSEIAKRSDNRVSIDLLPGWLLDKTHLWVYFSSHYLQMNSESVYLKP